MSKGEETRQFIIETAAPIFNKKGIEATALSDIMEATKLSKGSIYRHFNDKEELARAAVAHNLDLLKYKVTAAINKVSTAKEKIFAFIDEMADILNPPVPGGCPMINFGMEADDTNQEINQQVHQMVEQSQKVLADILKLGIRSGEFKADLNYKEFATILLATIEGGVVISRVARNGNKMKIITSHLRKMINDQLL